MHNPGGAVNRERARTTLLALSLGAAVVACSAAATHSSGSATASGGGVGGSHVGTGSAGNGGAGEGGAGEGGAPTMGCEPNATRACYEGPPGTKDVGACHGGTDSCLDDGRGWMGCAGQVLPAPESCLSPLDDDCDGKTNEAGEGCACKPKSSAYCYEGDPKTENIGACIPGVRMCSEDGSAWGECTGQILPGIESCTTPVDEDCDGKNPLCATSWAVTGGDAAGQFIHAMSVDATGNIIVAGEFEGTFSLGGVTLTSTGGVDVFVVKLDSTGKALWGYGFGDPTDNQAALGVAVDAAGNALVTGYFRSTIAFGATTLTSVGGSDTFVAKLAAADGLPLWAARFGNVSDDQNALGITVDGSGNPVLTGAFAGTMTFNGNITAIGAQDAFVAKLDGATGAALWGTRFGGTDYEIGRAVVVDLQGRVHVVGDFSGAFSLAGKNLASAGSTDVLVARFDGSTGAATYAARFGGTGSDAGRAAALGAAGGPLLAGEFENAIDFGGGVLTSAGGLDLFVVELDAKSAHLQSRRFGGSGDESAHALARDANGYVALGGFTTGTLEFGTGALTSQGGRDVLVAKLDPMLAGHWARAHGDPSFYQQATAVGIGPQGDVHAAGFFTGKADFGTGTATSAGNTDVFLVSYPP